MTHFRFILVTLAVATLSSCGSGESGNLEISLTGNTVQMIPSDTSSCTAKQQAIGSTSAPAKDISAHYFPLQSAVIKVNGGSSPYKIVRISVTMASNKLQGAVNCTIDEDELTWAFGGAALTAGVAWSRVILPGESKSVNPVCASLKCGGVKFVDDTKSFSGAAKVEMIAAELNPENLTEEVGAARVTTILSVEKK